MLDVADNHTNTQRNPDNPKITKGPNIPPCDMRMGESVSPIAHPRKEQNQQLKNTVVKRIDGDKKGTRRSYVTVAKDT